MSKSFNFSSEIIFGQLLQTFGNFLRVTLLTSYIILFLVKFEESVRLKVIKLQTVRSHCDAQFGLQKYVCFEALKESEKSRTKVIKVRQ